MQTRATQLIDRARKQTELSELGDESFIEGLEVLVASLDAEANLNEGGRVAMDRQLVELLINRLRVEDLFNRYPDIAGEQIVEPLIGIGLPRTGSTALACLLGEDPHYRTLRNWEAINPLPPMVEGHAAADSRLAAAEALMKRRAQLYPRMTAMVPSTATSPTECQLFMGYDFKSQIFQAFAHIPSYVRWLNHKADLVPTYRYVRRILQLLQWRKPPLRWRIKNPSHSLFINALDQIFPDARFVMTHRDVTQVLPSVADLYFELHKPFSDTIDLPAIGEDVSEFCELGMRRMIAFRDTGENHRFFDIYFEQFQADPFTGIAALYTFLGTKLTSEALASMAAWREAHPREGAAYLRTEPAEFGMSKAELSHRFEFYSRRFGLTPA